MVNKVILVGNLGKDAESKSVNEKFVLTFSLATSETYKNKNGEKVTNTEWHNIKYWINSDNLTQYLTKGKTIAIEGKLKTDVYEKDGQKRYTTYVLANSVCFVSSSNKKEQKDDDLPEEAVKDEEDLPF